MKTTAKKKPVGERSEPVRPSGTKQETRRSRTSPTKAAAKPAKQEAGLAGARALDAKKFEVDLLSFINTTLVPTGKSAVAAESALFDDGLINSIKILDLIAFVEKSLGVRIPEKLMVMKHFKSPRAITTTFARS